MTPRCRKRLCNFLRSGDRTCVSDFKNRAASKINSKLQAPCEKSRERKDNDRAREDVEEFSVFNDEHNYFESPLPNKKCATFDALATPSAKRNVRVTVMAVNMETRTPITKTSAKPLITAVPPSQKRMTPVIIDERFESRILVHAIQTFR